MRVFRHYQNLPPAARRAVVAIGNFDGVHLGHQAVLRRARALADERRAPLGVLVFEPHPREFFAPQAAPLRLMTLETKVRHLKELGVDFVYALSFDYELSRMSAPDFVQEVLVSGLQAVHVVVGQDFYFGRDRSGDAAALSYMGEEEGFGVTVLDAVEDEDEPGTEHSSTRIREALRAGEPERAAAMLGRWWTIEGPVMEGDKRGRSIGFPTANVDLGRLVHPRLGVYAIRVEVLEGFHKGVYDGAANVGERPTFGTSDVTLEAHLFDFCGDLYGTAISVALISFIRPEMKFDGVESLKAQIAKDCEAARRTLAHMAPAAGQAAAETEGASGVRDATDVRDCKSGCK
ncbi:MAG: bifunctional riboflavin kinase/FAD synthetase [Alphaproteobacteria bacterium]